MNTTALIVTFNRLTKLKECWARTREVAFTHIVIVDNASSDGTRAWLSTLDEPRLTLLRSERNLGGAGGFRYGADYIVSRLDTHWVVFYDDDSWPCADFIARFSEVRDARWGGYCGKVVNTRHHLCKMNLPYIALPRTFFGDIRAMLGGGPVAPDGQRAVDVDTFSFVGAILDKRILEQSLGYIFADLFIYYDDLYFSYHLRLQGCRIRYSPELMFIHDIPSETSGIAPKWKVYYLVRNLLLSRRLFQAHRPYSWGAIGLRICKYLGLGLYQSGKIEYTKYVLSGIWDGLSGKTGKKF
ncbi:glycosyltransferase [Martelella alba]|uniref:Glycosyltransferase n=1 Tax=Martelella alba TaxID=2590451 RepID=A0ABY2SJT6_9HYPH|nr:glycosyltransferase [Martelella alba]TKI05758.1 glycosyltransferase [Martelella alba]